MPVDAPVINAVPFNEVLGEVMVVSLSEYSPDGMSGAGNHSDRDAQHPQ
jgi:hypothetical protein